MLTISAPYPAMFSPRFPFWLASLLPGVSFCCATKLFLGRRKHTCLLTPKTESTTGQSMDATKA